MFGWGLKFDFRDIIKCKGGTMISVIKFLEGSMKTDNWYKLFLILDSTN